MNTTLRPDCMLGTTVQHDGPTRTQIAGALTILVAASVAFVVMFLWPVVTRFV